MRICFRIRVSATCLGGRTPAHGRLYMSDHLVQLRLSRNFRDLEALLFAIGEWEDRFELILDRGRKMGKRMTLEYLKMKTEASDVLIQSDLRELGAAARQLAHHALAIGFGTTFLKFFASLAAIYLLVLDRTNWRTNMLTSLLVPYIFLSLPDSVFYLLRGEVGKWVAFVAVVLRLFFPRHFPDWLEMPGSLILLLVVAPSFLADTIRHNVVGVFICLIIACYLLQEHIRASGGFRNSFTKANGVSNSIGIILLMVYPVWSLLLSFT